MSQDPSVNRTTGGTSRDERRRRLRAAQAGQPVPRTTVGVTHEQRRLAAEADFAGRKRRNTIIVVISFLVALGMLVSLVLTNIPVAGAANEFNLKNQAHLNKFPEGIEFTLEASAVDPIKSATLQYTIDSGNGVIGVYGRPEEFTAGTDVKAKFFHNNKKSYLPPGTRVSYYWEMENTKGEKFKSEEVKFVQDDPRFKWKSLNKGGVTAYWYEGSDAFGKSIVDTTQEAIDRLSGKLGLVYDKPMMVWAYNSKKDIDGALQPRSSTYDQSIITLGQRTTAEIMLLLGNHPQYLDTISHEVGHMVVHQFAEGPLSSLPSWLDEGLAMNAQPTVEASYDAQIEAAKRRNNLMSVRTMTGVASDPQGVDLFYGQAYSIVKYLTDSFGQKKMVDLLLTLKSGTNIDKALTQTYNFDQDGLDDEWRKYIGAQPRPASERGRVDIAPQAVPTIGLMTQPQSNMPAGSGGATASGSATTGGTAQPGESQPAVAAGGGSMLFMAGAGLVVLGLLAAGVMLAQGMFRKPNA